MMRKKINFGAHIVVGIDYSMSSPALCIHKSDHGAPWSFDNCRFYFITDKKKCLVKDDFFCGQPHEEYLTQEQRFNNIGAWASFLISDEAFVYMEGYAFGARGQVFNIGENGGVLKNKLWNKNPSRPINIISPPTAKKFATGSGAANKVAMQEAFVKETGVKIDAHFGVTAGSSPASDIVDAYYIAKYGFEQEINKSK